MPLWLIIGIGSFIGGILRYWISGWVQSGALTFPLGTLVVNFIGSLVLSLIMYLSEHAGLFSEEIRIFWTIGLLGSFTTMSAFSYESFRLLEQNENMLFGLNMVGTVILTLAAVYLGKLVVLNFMVGTK
ncbi:MAG: fluoride efflux transporter CrcB [Nitrospinales bacterium]|jgi:CrcB protein|uniref:Fluoride ion transporter CrcB n=1 Tax=marine metagenome TaxID=408172 RepID=A0A382NHB1_9ZZZZ|nr:fluoride efflux transporter CrcB [Nitrospinales bacterium]|tara:strand:+ start:275 stop:661 length:387 start_codon:yes stop_codon:yes gene_type:complete